jgi:hypothetical protein
VECVSKGREEAWYAVLPQPFRVGLGGLGGENPQHLAESADASFTSDRSEVNDNLRPAAGRKAGPQRVGEREVVNQLARAWPFNFGE